MELPPMKTGFNPITIEEPRPIVTEEEIQKLLAVFTQNAITNASSYSKASGRDNLSSQDMIYGLKYEAFTFCKNNTLKGYLEMYDSCSESDDECDTDESEYEIMEENEEFSEAPDDASEMIRTMNHVNQFWSSWEPENQIEVILKESIDRTIDIQLKES